MEFQSASPTLTYNNISTNRRMTSNYSHLCSPSQVLISMKYDYWIITGDGPDEKCFSGENVSLSEMLSSSDVC